MMKRSESYSSSFRRRMIVNSTVIFSLLIIGIYTVDYGLLKSSPVVSGNKSYTPSFTHRKLLNHVAENKDIKGNESENGVKPNRIWSEKCSKSDIVISQGATEPLPNGIPTYTVEIMNVSGCDISAIHFSCGWFSSARLLNPRLFKRLRFDDCLVNDGKPLVNGRTITFQYANTFRYPLSVTSVTC